MTVRDLREAIKDLPELMEVFIDERSNDEFQYNLANTCEVREVKFRESSGGAVLSKQDVFVIADD